MSISQLTERFWATTAGRMVLGTLHLNLVDRALAMSSKAFVVMIPLSILTGAVIEGQDFGESLIMRFDLTGAGADAAEMLFKSPDAVRSGISVLGLGFLLFGLLSLARGLERVYLDAWGLDTEPGSVRRRLSWIVGVVVFISVAGPIRRRLDDVGVQITLGVVNLALGTLLWVWTPYVLLARRIAARELLPTGLLTAASTTALGIASLVYMPHVMSTNASRYGLIGVTFALVSWLFAYGCAVVGAIIVGAVLAGRDPAGAGARPAGGT